MKRFLMLVAVTLPLAVGCGQPQLIAEAALTDEAGERLALSDLPIRLLPYDRDAVFDSLETAYATPEPPIPQEIIAQQGAVQEAQTQWTQAEAAWAAALDEQRTVADQMQGMNRQAPQYAQLFQRFNALEDQVESLDQQRQQAFDQFTTLQQQVLADAETIRAQRDLWAEEAFADFNTVVAAKLQERGAEELADTTNAQGFASFNVPEGQWWVYSRYTLPYEELYWNVPVEVSGDSVFIQLNRDNAQIRPVL